MPSSARLLSAAGVAVSQPCARPLTKPDFVIHCAEPLRPPRYKSEWFGFPEHPIYRKGRNDGRKRNAKELTGEGYCRMEDRRRDKKPKQPISLRIG